MKSCIANGNWRTRLLVPFVKVIDVPVAGHFGLPRRRGCERDSRECEWTARRSTRMLTAGHGLDEIRISVRVCLGLTYASF